MRISLLLIILFVVSCNYTSTSNRVVILDPNALIGKNKAEIIGMTLQSSPKTADGETIVKSSDAHRSATDWRIGGQPTTLKVGILAVF